MPVRVRCQLQSKKVTMQMMMLMTAHLVKSLCVGVHQTVEKEDVRAGRHLHHGYDHINDDDIDDNIDDIIGDDNDDDMMMIIKLMMILMMMI